MTEWPERSKYVERQAAGADDRYLAQVVCCRQRRAERKRPAELVVSGGRQLHYDGMAREIEVCGRHAAGAHDRFLAQVLCSRQRRAECKRPAKLVVSGGQWRAFKLASSYRLV